MEIGPKEHPLTTTQALASFTVAALFWALGVALIDSRGMVGIILCILGIAATFWLFWNAIYIIPTTSIKEWPWVGISLIVIEVIVPSYLFFAKPSDEDLRVSFRFEQNSRDKITVSYLFENLGRQSAFVNGVGLFEIATISSQGQATENIDLCKKIDGATYNIVNFTGHLFPDSQTGIGESKAIYSPSEVKVDDVPHISKNPISVETGKTRILSASYNLNLTHMKDADTRVLCPIISLIAKNGSSFISLCNGTVTTMRLTADFGHTTMSATTGQQFKILPHTKDIACPLAN